MVPIRYLTLAGAVLAIAVASLAMPRAANAGGGCHIPGTSDSTSTTVAMRGNCFVSTVTRVEEGATVTWVNEDDVAHNVTGAGYTWGGDNEVFRAGTVEQTFDENGTYVYACLLHPGMVGAIVVGDGSGDGSATLANYVEEDPAAPGVGNPELPQRDANGSSAAAHGDSDGTNTMLIVGAIAAGIAAVIALAAGSMAYGRAVANRNVPAN